MENGKFDLNLQVLEQLPEQLRAKTIYKLGEESPLLWEVIVKYHGNLAQRGKELSVQVEELENNVAIVFLRPEQLQAFSRFPEVDYMELPRRLWYNLNESKQGICLDGLQRTGYPASNAVDVLNGDAGNQDKSNLYGAGVLIAIIDSGIEYANMDFRNADGTTRIVALWDQTVDSSTVNEENQQFTYGPPTGYILGTLFTEEMINTALQQTDRQRRYAIVPSIDVSGHGTHVAGIACGNGNASNGTIRGVAPLAQMLIVKLGDAQGITFPRTTRLLEAIDFTIKTAEELNMPVAINLSFGNNAGPHTGTDLVSE
ncbi:MAG: S8 family serine peptidase, partial [Lachnospiraceae bacterium]|nr:S8 family serine peptidase [Lachnospiraceae bacterium]